jgi:tryptophanase
VSADLQGLPGLPGPPGLPGLPDFRPRTIIEAFRIKVVEPIPLVDRARRFAALEAANLNLFALDASDVTIDLLTDSGTGAMSADQWAAIMRGDESYAGSISFRRFERVVRDLTGMEHVIPVHQGRAAEHLLFSLVARPGTVIPSNNHFDTTRANAEDCGARAVDLVIAEGRDPTSEHPFKGNVDLDALERCLAENEGRVPVGMVTVTNNAGGGQPVSLENLRGVRDVLHRHGVPFILDACRFAENAWFIKQREPGQGRRTPKEIAQETFSLADGATFSAKKDGLANIGGFLALRDAELAARARNRLILTEGFPTYGGLAGRDLEAIAVGLVEVVDESYLSYRHASVQYFGRKLTDAGLPLLVPFGGHAVYLDARRFLPHLSPGDFPGQALAVALYLHGGVRGVEVGSVMLGRRDAATGREEPAPMDLVRLAMPRRVYTQSHVDYVAEVAIDLHRHREAVRGIEIVAQPPALRHFTAKFRHR